MTGFAQLPIELIASIFCKLDLESKLVARQVCWEWKYVLDTLFMKFQVLLTNQSMPYVRRCGQLNVDTLQVRNFSRKILQSMDLTNNQLYLHPKKIVFMRKPKTITKASVSPENTVEVLERNGGIEYLRWDFNTLQYNDLQGIQQIQFQNLKQLKICINPTKIERQNLDILAQLKLPVLEIIQIFSRFQSDLDENMRVYLDYYKIIANHKSTLRIINLIHPICSRRISTDASATGTSSLPSYMSREELASLKRDLAETQLTGVYINFDKNEGCDEYNLGFHLLQSQRSITTLHVNFRENSQVSESGIQAIIHNNASTLTCIDLIANKRLVALVNINEHLLTLRGCNQLKILRLVNFKTTNLPSFVPATLKELLLWGELKAVELLPKIRSEFQDLERLDFFDMEGSQVGNDYLNRKFRELLLLPKLKAIHWYKKNFDLSFINELNGVKKQPFVITSAWSWPLKKSHLEGAMFISKG